MTEGNNVNIYGPDLNYDPDLAAAELRALPAVSNKEAKREGFAFLQTAALIDIADSLRTLAVESAIAMSRRGDLDRDAPPVGGPLGFGGYRPDDVAITDAERNSFAVLDAVEGQRVRSLVNFETYGEHAPWLGTLTGLSGIDQGEAWAEVVWDDRGTVRVFARTIEAIEPTTITELAESAVPLVGVATEAEAPELLDERGTDEDGQPAVGGYDLDDELTPTDAEGNFIEGSDTEPNGHVVDDIDADFEGDRHDATATAVEALKARRKAAKKGKGK